MHKGVQLTQKELRRRSDEERELINGWALVLEDIGRYGTNYGMRAAVSMIGLGALPPEEAVYPNTYVDSNGQRLNGANKYLLRFEYLNI